MSDINELEVSPSPSPSAAPSPSASPEVEINAAEFDPVLVDLIVNAVLEELESQSPTPLPVEIVNYENVSLDTGLNDLNFPALAICIALLLFFIVLGWRLGNE